MSMRETRWLRNSSRGKPPDPAENGVMIRRHPLQVNRAGRRHQAQCKRSLLGALRQSQTVPQE
ncbi:hypothetical protein P3T16_001697 [Paraburkholderia sp. GAS42]